MSVAISQPKRPSRHIGLWILGTLVVAIIAVVALWDWDWFLPLVDAQASSAVGRKVTAQHMHVHLGRVTTVAFDDVEIASTDGYPTDKPFAHVGTLTVAADVMAYVRSRQIVIPQIILDKPVVEADEDAKGQSNWPSSTSSSSSSDKPDPNAGPRIGQLVIKDGQAHVAIAKLKADFGLAISTKDADPSAGTPDKQAGELVVDAKGTYAAAPILGQFVGGALLSLRDPAQPYPVDLHLENGPTKVSLKGTLQNPLNFAGADLKLAFSGPDAALLTPLTGVPVPQTPAYSIAGKLDYADKKIRFTGFTGKLGSSDLNGDILVDPTRSPPFVDANLFSHRVDLVDLGGFIGATPGHKGEAGTTQPTARKDASDKLLPDTPISLPKLTMADVKLRYKGEKIQGRSVPLDNIVADIDIENGRINVHPLSFAVGTGSASLDAALAPVGRDLKADMTFQFKQLDLARMLAATHLVEGAGTMSGSAKLASTGNSLGSLLANGDGGLRLGMSGGNLSALLVDIAGLEFGNALLSALGIPSRANLECFALDMPLQHGTLSAKTFVLDTSEAQVQGSGTINLASEALDLKLKTASKHFSIGTLPTPIDINGHLKSPGISPEVGPLAARAGAAVGLGVLFPPAALLPLISFGTGDDNGACLKAEAPIARSTPAAANAIPHGRPSGHPASRSRRP